MYNIVSMGILVYIIQNFHSDEVPLEYLEDIINDGDNGLY